MPQEEASLNHGLRDAAARGIAALASDPPGRVVIDGRSGSGKTVLARRIAAKSGARLVSLDEFYPGWSGLSRGTEIAERILAAHAEGLTGEYRRWDWQRDAWLPERHAVDPARPLIVEGCGALTRTTARLATWSLWLDADPAVRKRRALSRDGEGFAPFWSMWTAQEDEHLRAHDAAALADRIVDSASGTARVTRDPRDSATG